MLRLVLKGYVIRVETTRQWGGILPDFVRTDMTPIPTAPPSSDPCFSALRNDGVGGGGRLFAWGGRRSTEGLVA